MWEYVLLVLGTLMVGIGLPSKSGARGEWGYALIALGFVLVTVGVSMTWVEHGWVSGLIAVVASLVAAKVINILKS